MAHSKKSPKVQERSRERALDEAVRRCTTATIRRQMHACDAFDRRFFAGEDPTVEQKYAPEVDRIREAFATLVKPAM